LWKELCLFLKKKRYSKHNKFVFTGQMSLRIIAELMKKAPVLLKRGHFGGFNPDGQVSKVT